MGQLVSYFKIPLNQVIVVKELTLQWLHLITDHYNCHCHFAESLLSNSCYFLLCRCMMIWIYPLQNCAYCRRVGMEGIMGTNFASTSFLICSFRMKHLSSVSLWKTRLFKFYTSYDSSGTPPTFWYSLAYLTREVLHFSEHTLLSSALSRHHTSQTFRC